MINDIILYSYSYDHQHEDLRIISLTNIPLKGQLRGENQDIINNILKPYTTTMPAYCLHVIVNSCMKLVESQKALASIYMI